MCLYAKPESHTKCSLIFTTQEFSTNRPNSSNAEQILNVVQSTQRWGRKLRNFCCVMSQLRQCNYSLDNFRSRRLYLDPFVILQWFLSYIKHFHPKPKWHLNYTSRWFYWPLLKHAGYDDACPKSPRDSHDANFVCLWNHVLLMFCLQLQHSSTTWRSVCVLCKAISIRLKIYRQRQKKRGEKNFQSDKRKWLFISLCRLQSFTSFLILRDFSPSHLGILNSTVVRF